MTKNIKLLLLKYKHYLSNTSWIMAEKVFNLGIAFFVTIFVARYLGPKQFGVLSYAISLVSLFAIAGHMGLSSLVIREIVKKPDELDTTLGTTFFLKLFGISMGFIFLVLFAFISEEIGSNEFWILIIVAASVLFTPFEVIDFWFASQVQSKYTSIAKSIALIISSAFKVLLIVGGASIVLFAYANIIQTLIVALLLIYFYKNNTINLMNNWSFSLVRAKELLSQGWMIFLGSIFAIIYLKVDQVMLKWLVGTEEVGIYSVASTLSEAWYFIPTAIIASLFPKLIKLRESDEKQFNKRLQQVFDLLFMLALSVAILVSLFASPIILLFFGEEYIASATILTIHIWAALFIFMRAAFSKWILIEGALMFSLITQGLGAIANVGLNFLLIPHYEGVGAAYATLISYAVASYISLFVYKKTRPVFWMMSKAIVSPIRYPVIYIKGKI